jgi:hypothetical protein
MEILYFIHRCPAKVRLFKVAANSKYSHLSIIYAVDNEYFAYEASSIAKFTPFNEWINNGLDGNYVVKRIKDSENMLITDALISMNNVG